MPSAIPNRITYLRKKRGLSMQKLALRVGTSQQQIDRLEKGKRRLTLEWMERLSAALDCGILDLLPEVHSERDVANTSKAKVIGSVDSSQDGELLEFEEREVYTVLFGRPKQVVSPRLFALVVRGDGISQYADGTELIFSEIERNQQIPAGKTVLCAARSGQYFVRTTPINHDSEIIKAVAVKQIRDI